MENTHEMDVCFQYGCKGSEEGIWLFCSCGYRKCLERAGYSKLNPDWVTEAAQAHRESVGITAAVSSTEGRETVP